MHNRYIREQSCLTLWVRKEEVTSCKSRTGSTAPGNDNARGQGKVKFKIPRLEDKITWQPAQIQFL